MDYFKHIYKGIEYEFKVNRISQARVEELQRNLRAKVDPKANEELPKIYMEAEKISKEIENKMAEYETADEKRKAEIDEECKPLFEKTMELQIKIQPFNDIIQTSEVYQKIMYILLDSLKNLDGSKMYPNLTEDLFEEILDDIEREYGLEQFTEICEAIAEDVFTKSGEEKAEPHKKSEFLANRKNRKG